MIAFVANDGGRSTSQRPRQKNDCAVRALAIAANLPYDTAYEMHAVRGRKCGRGTPKAISRAIFAELGFSKLSFPAIAGQRRMSLASFVNSFSKGRYIVQMAGHLTAVVDGVVYDTFIPRPHGCVYVAWQVEKGE